MKKELLFQFFAGAGFLVSVYALYIKHRLVKSPDYSPICDISTHISCSKALGSSYSRTMGVPNPVGGLFYYFTSAILANIPMARPYLFYLTLPAVFFSIYLAYISYFRQRNFCLICSFIYLVNLILAVLANGMG